MFSTISRTLQWDLVATPAGNERGRQEPFFLSRRFLHNGPSTLMLGRRTERVASNSKAAPVPPSPTWLLRPPPRHYWKAPRQYTQSTCRRRVLVDRVGNRPTNKTKKDRIESTRSGNQPKTMLHMRGVRLRHPISRRFQTPTTTFIPPGAAAEGNGGAEVNDHIYRIWEEKNYLTFKTTSLIQGSSKVEIFQ